jgi:hypothetical protein
MIELKWGQALISSIEHCEPVVNSFHDIAKEVRLGTVASTLNAFKRALLAQQSEGETHISDKGKTELLRIYDRLVTAVPDLKLDAVRNQREALIIEALLRSIPLQCLAIDKLYEAGHKQLDSYFNASPEDLVKVSNLSHDQASKVIGVFQEYQTHHKGCLLAATAPRAEYKNLKNALGELLRDDKSYERATQSWTQEALAAQKVFRAARNKAAWRMLVSVVRLGDLAYAADLQRQSHKHKLESVYAYLVSAAKAEKARRKE